MFLAILKGIVRLKKIPPSPTESGLAKWKKHTYFSPLMMFACFLALCVSYDFPDARNGALPRVLIFFLCWKPGILATPVLKCIYSSLKIGEEGAIQDLSMCPWELRMGKEGFSPGVWFPSSFTLTPDTTKSSCSQRKDGKIKMPLPISLGNTDHHCL